MAEKQWLVSRLDVYHKTIFDELQLSRDDFIRIREDVTSNIRSKRNAILSAVVFALAILVSLYETHWIDEKIFLGFLIPDLIIGLGVFLILSKFINSNSSAFIRIENSIIHAQQSLNQNYGFLMEKTLDLTSVSMVILNSYTDCMASLSGIVLIPFRDALIKSSKYKLLVRYYKKLFADYAKGFEKTIDPSMSLFTKMDKRSLPSQTIEYIQTAILQYTKENDKTKK